VDFNSGNFVHSLRFEYLKFKNVISQPSTGVAITAPLLTTVNIGGGTQDQL